MKIVNKYILADCMKSVSFYDLDCCEKIFKNLNPDDEMEVKSIIKYRIFLDFCVKSNDYKTTFKNTLIYFLNTDQIDFEEVFDDAYSSIPITKNPKTFFIWLWEVFYGYEDLRISKDDLHQFNVENDCKKIELLNKN